MRSDFLHAHLITERVTSDRDVQVQLGANQMQARGGLDYDHATGRLVLRGPLRTVISPSLRP